MFLPRLFLLMGAACFFATACTRPVEKKQFHFTSLPSSQTGIDFENRITENDSLNLFIHEYAYMGGGVGIGDFNRDGLPDIFFTSNQGSSQLYLNKGHLKFENITQKAGVSTKGWCTGVSIVDINHDGWPDIYVCVSGLVPGDRRKNLLFINRHDLTFTEEAEAYNLADTSYSTQAVFFDYDKDGDLDMYLLNHNLKGEKTNDVRPRIRDGSSLSADRLYRNEGTPEGLNHPVFKNVSREAGILEDGYGLGVVVSDLNGDGYPDIYVANDYVRNDVLWLNNRNGTFTNAIASSMRHQGYSSMGADAADFNNDGLPDLATLDMQPETNQRKKMMYSFLSYDRYMEERFKGYEPEFMRNMLQVNNGSRMLNGRSEPYFSEIGQLAGISETDWSWSVLMADFDNDGKKDMHISNGMGRDLINADFIEYKFNTLGNTGGINQDELRKSFVDRLASMGPVPMRNYLYHNTGDLHFEDISIQAGLTEKQISNGAVYADLDNDGDLDIITNNINGPATILRNDLYSGDRPPEPRELRGNKIPGGGKEQDSIAPGYLTLRLTGDSLNTEGLGTQIYVFSGGAVQMLEQYPVRGYLSSVDPRIHIGLEKKEIDSLQIAWPDGKLQVIIHPGINRILTVRYSEAKILPYWPATRTLLFAPSLHPLFTDISGQTGTDFRHQESFFNDYAYQPLIPQKYSQEGPFLSTGDMNGDGREDFFIGGAYKQSGKLYFQQPDGGFKSRDLITGTKNQEDMQSVLFDADKDGDSDLFIAEGSSEFDINSPFYHPRLYRNDSKGNFTWDSTAIPGQVITAARCLAAADFDGDGYTDVFIGGRVILGRYPESPRSFLLKNDHGKFVDVTAKICPALQNAGMITSAIWADIDNDHHPELILTGDWMSIRIFKYRQGILEEITASSGMQGLNGMWRSLSVADLNNDGYPDIIAGNMGTNQPFHIGKDQPASLYYADFDGNGIIDPIFCYYIRDETGGYRLYPGINRDQWARQLPSIKKQFNRNELFARATLSEILSPESLAQFNAQVLSCNEVRSGWFSNDGKGHFQFHPFPVEAQIAPVNVSLAGDFDHDGKMDLLLAGNEYEYNIMVGRMDASYGLLLKGDGKGGFNAVPSKVSGLALEGDIRDLKWISKEIILVARNNDTMITLRNN
ncbi:VCBS repeat-containing protein [Flavitalea flava]